MTADKPEILLVGTAKPVIVGGLDPIATVHRMIEAEDPESFLAAIAERVRGIAVAYTANRIDAAFMQRFPRLEIVASFGVGYDHVDAAWAGRNGIVVTNTPEVLDEEVADTALGLLLCTVRELPQAERHLRAGKWAETPYRLSRATLRDRTVGLVGMGRIGRAIARRLDAFRVPVVYHTRRPVADVPYRHYPSLVAMARDVDILLAIVPGGEATRHLIDAEVLAALGPDGILINMARGSVVDEAALIRALQARTILSAGLDVYATEPLVPAELIAMEHVVLFPHLGSGSVHTRARMDQLVVDNLASWFAGDGPKTPVPETPWRPGGGAVAGAAGAVSAG
ncbi:2-ketogluconate reductase [Rhodoplanes serenus]|uniref:2-ketogluconate reductase n=1 Tax=Rhodoplanes serenus TaxID=200615 RepID=A0A3S4CDX4_9BRAD|nr:2-hydroxyacid dehydrogenase [Rhodoplanes serenus]VCU06665.1 2-ketogluconate reductase [Rhodoplanes serenus]